MSVEPITPESVEPEVTDSLRGAKSTDQVVKSKIAYAPPTYLRIIRITVSTLIGAVAIALFTWLYVTAYERANYIDVDQYIAEKYEGLKEQGELLPVEDRTELIFPGSSKLSGAGLEDLKTFTQVVTVQFVSSEISEIRREDSVIYFKIDTAEYSLGLSSEESYPFFDKMIKAGDFDFSRYLYSTTTTEGDKENNTNG